MNLGRADSAIDQTGATPVTTARARAAVGVLVEGGPSCPFGIRGSLEARIPQAKSFGVGLHFQSARRVALHATLLLYRLMLRAVALLSAASAGGGIVQPILGLFVAPTWNGKVHGGRHTLAGTDDDIVVRARWG